MRHSGVYAIRNTVTGESFFASSVDIHRAWKRHRELLRGDQHFNHALQDEWLKFGEAAFTFTLLDETTGRTASAADLRRAVRERIEREKPNYNTDFWPRTRVHANIPPTRTLLSTRDGERPMSEESAAQSGEAGEPSRLTVLRQETYRVPLFEHDVPLLHASDGMAYVPVEAWYDMLGVRMKTHLWRLKRIVGWQSARELPCTFPAPGPAVAGSRAAGADGAPAAITETRLVWCLPLKLAGYIGFTIPRTVIQPETWDLLVVLTHRQMEEEVRPWKDRIERVQRYRAVRARLYESLRIYQELERAVPTIAQIVEHVLEHHHLDAVAGAELDLLRAHGEAVLAAAAAAARTAVSHLRTGPVRDVTLLDHYGAIAESYTIPEDPVIPDLADYETCEQEVVAWWQAMAGRLASHGIRVGRRPHAGEAEAEGPGDTPEEE